MAGKKNLLMGINIWAGEGMRKRPWGEAGGGVGEEGSPALAGCGEESWPG